MGSTGAPQTILARAGLRRLPIGRATLPQIRPEDMSKIQTPVHIIDGPDDIHDVARMAGSGQSSAASPPGICDDGPLVSLLR